MTLWQSGNIQWKLATRGLTGADLLLYPYFRVPLTTWKLTSITPKNMVSINRLGDTAGPGGLMRALRTIPMFETIAKAIKRLLSRCLGTKLY